MIHTERIRKDFPLLSSNENYIYLDNAASTQKPLQVIEAVKECYESYYSNVHRGVHRLSQKATDAFEKSRNTVRDFINAGKSSEIVFTKGCTESINLVASCMDKYLQRGDEIVITTLEHHSNIVPWQQLCHRTGAVLQVIGIDEHQRLLDEDIETLINAKTKIVAVTHISNTVGTVNPIHRIITKAKNYHAITLIDAAQSIQHMEIDVRGMGCDFLVFSGHKAFGPSGVGVLYGKSEILEDLPPYQFGGEMISEVRFEKTTFNELPFRMEAGTPNIEGVIGLGKALEYIQSIGIQKIKDYECTLTAYAEKKLKGIEGLKIYGDQTKISVLSFNLENTHHYDVGTLLDESGIAVRTGNHCTQPLMNALKISGTVRASFAFYNTTDEVDRLCESLFKVKSLLSL